MLGTVDIPTGFGGVSGIIRYQVLQWLPGQIQVDTELGEASATMLSSRSGSPHVVAGAEVGGKA